MKQLRIVSLFALVAVGAVQAKFVNSLLEDRTIKAGLESGDGGELDTPGTSFKEQKDDGTVVIAISRDRTVTPVSLTVTGSKLIKRKIKGDGEKKFIVRYMDATGAVKLIVADADEEVTLTDVVHIDRAVFGIPGEKKQYRDVRRQLSKLFFKEQTGFKKEHKKQHRKAMKAKRSERKKAKRLEQTAFDTESDVDFDDEE